MTTQEGNKLIAEFMGLMFEPTKKDNAKFYKLTIDGGWESRTYCEPKYHSSWDWLMPVVEKLFTELLHVGTMDAADKYRKVSNALIAVNIKMVYPYVLEAIKFINQTKDK